LKKVLIIEDDKNIRRFLQLELEHEGYKVTTSENGEVGIAQFKKEIFDIILLDLMMPKLSGEEVCKIIRESSEIPIIVLTAKDHFLNKVELLDMGADDYLTKPFQIEELFARMRVVFRNKKDYKIYDSLIYKEFKLDKNLKTLFKNGVEIQLTKKEYNLMYLFLLNKEIVISREKIIEEIWGYDFNGDDKIVDVYINLLRKKIESKDEKYIHTVRGFGYILKNLVV
jgi:two-component system response regulator ArlR